MGRLEISLGYRSLRATGDTVLWADLVLSLKTNGGAWEMDPTEFVFPCYFIGDPNNLPPAPPRNLLGLTGVINQIRLTFEGTTSALAPWGILVVEKL